MDEIVPVKERNERSKMLRILSEKKKRAFYEENIGTTRTVLYEDDINNGKMHGFTENYLRVEAAYDPLLINETQHVVIKGISERMTMQVELEAPQMIVS
jgi:threonylcarbamoyladenosine tRNA methylthiotransferase MtaB